MIERRNTPSKADLYHLSFVHYDYNGTRRIPLCIRECLLPLYQQACTDIVGGALRAYTDAHVRMYTFRLGVCRPSPAL